jgi:hypothetical protein
MSVGEWRSEKMRKNKSKEDGWNTKLNVIKYLGGAFGLEICENWEV